MKGRFSGDRGLAAPATKRLAHRHAQRAAQEIEGLHRDHHRQAVQRAARGGEGFGPAGLGLGRLHLVGIFLLAPETQRIGWHAGRRQFGEGTGDRRYRRSARPARCACDSRIWGRHCRLAIRSRWKIISPQDGHFFQRFSGVSPPPALAAHQALDAGTDEIGDPVHAAHLTTGAPHGWNRPERGHSSSTSATISVLRRRPGCPRSG